MSRAVGAGVREGEERPTASRASERLRRSPAPSHFDRAVLTDPDRAQGGEGSARPLRTVRQGPGTPDPARRHLAPTDTRSRRRPNSVVRGRGSSGAGWAVSGGAPRWTFRVGRLSSFFARARRSRGQWRCLRESRRTARRR